MTRNELKQKTAELLGFAPADNQARASELLTEITDGFNSVLTESEGNANKVQELTANNEKLRSVNAMLFLKVGNTEKENHKQEHSTEKADKPDTELSFEKLFNEKGELI